MGMRRGEEVEGDIRREEVLLQRGLQESRQMVLEDTECFTGRASVAVWHAGHGEARRGGLTSTQVGSILVGRFFLRPRPVIPQPIGGLEVVARELASCLLGRLPRQEAGGISSRPRRRLPCRQRRAVFTRSSSGGAGDTAAREVAAHQRSTRRTSRCGSGGSESCDCHDYDRGENPR